MKAAFGISLSIMMAFPSVGVSQDIDAAGRALLWELGYDGRGTAIAILDGAIDDRHPLLSEKVVLEACFSASEILECGKDARKLETGEVVDVSEHSASCSRSAKDGASERFDMCDHTTHVAGIAAGASLREAPASGIAKGASIVAVKIIDAQGSTNTASILRGLTWITAKVKEQRSTGFGPNIVAVNMSFGGGFYSDACDKEGDYAGVVRRIRELKGEGVAIFAAAGNDARDGVGFPACMSDVIAIGAIGKEDKISDFTNYSSIVGLVTGGENIVSSVAGGGYRALSGTSMATAAATGAYAVLKSAFPEMDADTITTALKTKGRPITVPQTSATVRAIDVASSYAFLRILASELEQAQRERGVAGAAR
jgi:subtilisin family serine protease